MMTILRGWAAAGAAILMVVAGAPALAQQTKPAPARQLDRAPSDVAARKAARVDRMFKLADRNRDNSVSRAEYLQWYRTTARRRSPLTWKTYAAKTFRQLDVGQAGRLTKMQFAEDPFFRRTRPGWATAGAPKSTDEASGAALEHEGSSQ
ncbi:hypothetical protein [Terrarubrum flagellatum]|uniref:hypothetical protein n=1 Tax=Terrirubrum flagellatum TaxID=2895980 RepID=UPI00314500B7